MVVVRVCLRLRFTGLPGIQGERVFRDAITIIDPHDHDYNEVREIVEKKLQFMNLPPCDFTVFYTDSKTGDRLVVDDAYLVELFVGLVEDTVPSSTTTTVVLGEEMQDDDGAVVEKRLSFDIEVGRTRMTHHQPLTVQEAPLPLTVSALQSLTVDNGIHLSIGSLTCPPKHPIFFIRAVVMAIRVKTPKPGVSVCEIDLCDAEETQQQITAMTFDTLVQKAVGETLKSDRKQVVELRHVYLRTKNETDKRFQTNTHPLLIRIDRGSKIEVVQVLPVPVPLRSENVVTVREKLRPVGLVNLCDLAALRDSSGTPAHSSYQKGPHITCSSSSSSAQSGARRTMLSFSSNTSLGAAQVSGVVPSQLGEQIRQQQAEFLSKRVREDPIHWEPDTPRVTTKDIRKRDAVVVQQTLREEDKKERIRRRKEVSQACIICGINCEEESSLRVVTDLLKNNSRNMGQHIPSMTELRHALSDRRLTKSGKSRGRLVCSEHFVDLRTRTLHVVHCRCVHLCSGYQRGSQLEDVVFCDLPMQACGLCGMPGASVSCYHPDCHEMYHTVCALFSCGYVNFGKKDPYLPCPACPKHTQVVISESNASPVVAGKGLAAWWEEDEVVFDSRVVEETDLRDPDENDGA